MRKRAVLITISLIVSFCGFISLTGNVSATSTMPNPPTLIAKDTDGDGYNDQVNVSITITSNAGLPSDFYLDVDLNDSQGNRIDYDYMYSGNIWLPTSPQTFYFDLDTTTISPIDTYTVDVYFDTDDFGGTDGSQSAQVSLNPKGSYTVFVNSVDIPDWRKEPGESVLWNLSIINMGNNPDTLSIDADSALNWDMQLSSSSLILDPDEGALVTLTVTIPTNVAADTKDTETITVTSEKDPTESDFYDAECYSSWQNFDISLTTSDDNQTIDLDDTALYSINIENNGNYEDGISLTAKKYSGGNWDVNIDKASVILLSGASTNAIVSVDTPSSYTVGEDKYSEVEVKATSKDGLTTEYLYFTTTIGLVDYYIDDVTFSNDNPDVGDEVTVTASIINYGTIDASNIIVSFYHNSSLIDSDSITSITKEGGTGDASITWVTVPGFQTIDVVVDASESDLEFDETDNSKTVDITVNTPDLAVSSIEFDNTYPNLGDEITITATITNFGTTDAINVNVYFESWSESLGDYIEDIDSDTISLIAKNGGESEVEVTWKIDILSLGNIEVLVKTDSSRGELNYDNNKESSSLYVNDPPSASLSVDKMEVELGYSFVFDASASVDSDGYLEYYIDFGDGKKLDWTSTSITTHEYEKIGKFTVILTVKDDNGATSTDTIEVTVKKNPLPTKSTINQPLKSDIKKDAITLSWSKNVDSDFEEYEVHMSMTPSFTPSDSTKLTTIDDINETSYTATGLKQGKKYYFKIQTTDNMGQSTDSDDLMIKTKKKAEDTPGFEFGAVLLTIVALSLIIRKRKRDNNGNC